MQKGNLKSLAKDQKKTKKSSWVSWLNPMRYTPWRLYDDFLNTFFGMQGKVETYFYYHSYPEVIDFPLFSAVKVMERPKDRACVEEIDLNSMKKVSRSLDFVPRVSKIYSALEFDYKIKWILLNFKRLVQIKALYPNLGRMPKVKGFKNFNLKERLHQRFVTSERIAIRKSLTTQEALLEMEPYIKALNKADLYAIPIEKEPMNKNFLSLSLLEKFKQKLSASAKVRPSEVKVISAYENVHIEIYKDLRHNTQQNTLMCYLDPNKTHIKNPKNFYLVFGQRLSDKKVFTIICES